MKSVHKIEPNGWDFNGFELTLATLFKVCDQFPVERISSSFFCRQGCGTKLDLVNCNRRAPLRNVPGQIDFAQIWPPYRVLCRLGDDIEPGSNYYRREVSRSSVTSILEITPRLSSNS